MKNRFAVPLSTVRSNPPPERIPHQRDGSDKNYLRLPGIFDQDTIQDLAALQQEGIDFVVCGSAAGALVLGRERLMRPSSDIDIMIDPDQYKRASAVLGGRQYRLRPLFGLGNQLIESAEVSFIEKGNLQVVAGSDYTPGNFSLTTLVKDNSTILNVSSPEDKEGKTVHCRLLIAPLEEVILNKLCWGREKDWHDYELLRAKAGDNLNYTFLAERIKETGTETHIRTRYKRAALNEEVLGRELQNHGIPL